MDDFSDLEFEDDAEKFDDEETPEGGNDNRTFWLIAGILGGILVLALVCMVVYAMVILPGRRDAQRATVNAQNTSVAMAAEMTAQAEAWTLTPSVTNTRSPVTATPSPTPLLAETNTPIAPGGTVDPRTATVSALLTQQAGGLTTTPTVTQLPDGGFADDVGLPGMVALAAALVVVIFLARRLRTANS